MKLNETSPGVFYSDEPLVTIGIREMDFVCKQAASNPTRRARICAHRDVNSPVHEMIICLCRESYVQPHCHRKCESLHIIEGSCDVVLFAKGGAINSRIPLGSGNSEVRFLRLPSEQFHTLIVRSDYIVFHETIEGPFRREDTVYADWAPAETDRSSTRDYVEEIVSSLAAIYSDRPIES